MCVCVGGCVHADRVCMVVHVSMHIYECVVVFVCVCVCVCARVHVQVM